MNIQYYLVFCMKQFLFQRGMDKPQKSIIEQPELQGYLIEHQQFNQYILRISEKKMIGAWLQK